MKMRDLEGVEKARSTHYGKTKRSCEPESYSALGSVALASTHTSRPVGQGSAASILADFRRYRDWRSGRGASTGR